MSFFRPGLYRISYLRMIYRGFFPHPDSNLHMTGQLPARNLLRQVLGKVYACLKVYEAYCAHQITRVIMPLFLFSS